MSKDKLDQRAGELIADFSQRMSRRGLVSALGRLMLRAAGVALVPVLLPVDRAYAQFSCSGDWQTCGMHGFFCKACCGHSARYASCPACTTTRAAWSKCCWDEGNCRSTWIMYVDCAWPAGGKPGFTINDAANCQGDECPPGGGTGSVAYIQSDDLFICTVIQNLGQHGCGVGGGSC